MAKKVGAKAKRKGGLKTAAKVKGPAKKANKQSASNALLSQMRQHVRAHGEQYLQDANITSVGVGYKMKAGQQTPELAIQFTVAEKVVPEALGVLGTEGIPKEITLASGKTVPTDVIQRSYKPSYLLVPSTVKDPRKARADRVCPGMSVGVVHTTAGTLGTFVTDGKTGRVVMLSNWHVLHTPDGELGDDIVQPGPFDDNQVAQNRVGQLLRSHLGTAGDCAIASLEARAFENLQFEVGNVVHELGDAELGDRVVKSGRTTGVTHGIVIRLDVLTKIEYASSVKACIAGFEIGPDEKHPAPENEISRGGDSGSVWMAVAPNGKPTDVMLGLHFAGDAENSVSEVAVACNARAVFKKLEIEPLPKASSAGTGTPQAVVEAEELQTGFDRNFLRFTVAPPGFTPTTRKDLIELNEDPELRYCHFSVWLSETHKMARCVAWNIDGSKIKKTNRLSFRTDRRGDLADHQLDNDLYVDNPLDKGHIARRADLSWGDTLEEAKKGNYDSFYYTNIAPQHERFNQSERFRGKWGMLENAIFDDVDLEDLKVSLLGGPIFRSTDRPFARGDWTVRLPEEFFKVVAYTDRADNVNKVKVFKLSQAKFLTTLLRPETLDLDDWVWAQITLDQLEADTGLRFPQAFRKLEVPFVVSESLGGAAMRLVLKSEDFFP